MSEKKFEIVCTPDLMKKIEDHCFSAVDVEVGGFLVGKVEGDKSIVTHVLKAKNTSAQSTQLTFTNKTWETAWSEISEISKEAKLIGWFHSHPNFGVFLSDYDKFIQNQFFHEDGMITIVVDPIRGKRGWFVSIDREVRAYAPEEDTQRTKLGESKKDADANIDSIVQRSRQSSSGIGTGRTIAIAAIFSIFSFMGGYALTAMQLVDYKGRLDRIEQDMILLQSQLLSSQSKEVAPAPENTGAPAANPKPVPVNSMKGQSSGKSSTTSSGTKKSLEGTDCPKEGKTTIIAGGKTVYTCTKVGKDKKLQWVISGIKAIPSASSSSSGPVGSASPKASISAVSPSSSAKLPSVNSPSPSKSAGNPIQNPVTTTSPQPEVSPSP